MEGITHRARGSNASGIGEVIMVRLTGIFIGGLISMAMLLTVLDSSEIDGMRTISGGLLDSAVERVSEYTRGFQKKEEMHSNEGPVVELNTAAKAPVGIVANVPREDELADQKDATGIIDVLTSEREVVADPQWHVFWKPFRSERSARGFSDHLQRLTGLDFQVMKTATGRYQVAFAYLDEQQRQANLEGIESVTGLHLEDHHNEPE